MNATARIGAFAGIAYVLASYRGIEQPAPEPAAA